MIQLKPLYLLYNGFPALFCAEKLMSLCNPLVTSGNREMSLGYQDNRKTGRVITLIWKTPGRSRVIVDRPDELSVDIPASGTDEARLWQDGVASGGFGISGMHTCGGIRFNIFGTWTT